MYNTPTSFRTSGMKGTFSTPQHGRGRAREFIRDPADGEENAGGSGVKRRRLQPPASYVSVVGDANNKATSNVVFSETTVPVEVDSFYASKCTGGGVWAERGLGWFGGDHKLFLWTLSDGKSGTSLTFPLPPAASIASHGRVRVAFVEQSARGPSAFTFTMAVVNDDGVCYVWRDIEWDAAAHTSGEYGQEVSHEVFIDAPDPITYLEGFHASSCLLCASHSTLWFIPLDEPDVQARSFPAASADHSLSASLLSGIGRVLWWGGDKQPAAQDGGEKKLSLNVLSVTREGDDRLLVLTDTSLHIYSVSQQREIEVVPLKQQIEYRFEEEEVTLHDIASIQYRSGGRATAVIGARRVGGFVLLLENTSSTRALAETEVLIPADQFDPTESWNICVSADGVAAYGWSERTVIPLDLRSAAVESAVEAEHAIIGCGREDRSEGNRSVSGSGVTFFCNHAVMMLVSQPQLALLEQSSSASSTKSDYERELINLITARRTRNLDIGRAIERLNSIVASSSRHQQAMVSAAIAASLFVVQSNLGDDARWADASASKAQSSMTIWHLKKQLEEKDATHYWLARVLCKSWLVDSPTARWVLHDRQVRIGAARRLLELESQELERTQGQSSLTKLLLLVMEKLAKDKSTVRDARNAQDAYYSDLFGMTSALLHLVAYERRQQKSRGTVDPFVVADVNRIALALIPWDRFADVREFNLSLASHECSDSLFSVLSSSDSAALFESLEAQCQLTHEAMQECMHVASNAPEAEEAACYRELCDELQRLTRIILESFAFSAGNPSAAADPRAMSRFVAIKRSLLPPLHQLNLSDEAVAFARQFEDFETLAEILLGGDWTASEALREECRRFRERGDRRFIFTVFELFAKAGCYRELLSSFRDFNEELDAFLRDPEHTWDSRYTWLVHVDQDRFKEAAEDLLSTAVDQQRLFERKTTASLAKLAALVSNDQQALQHSDALLFQLEVQQAIMPDEGKVLPLEEVIDRIFPLSDRERADLGGEELDAIKAQLTQALHTLMQGEKRGVDTSRAMRRLWNTAVSLDRFTEQSYTPVEARVQHSVTLALATHVLRERSSVDRRFEILQLVLRQKATESELDVDALHEFEAMCHELFLALQALQ